MHQLPPLISAGQIVHAIGAEARGADKLCWMISSWDGIDRKPLPLPEAIQKAVGLGLGTVVSVLPGILAYYESETGHRFLLRSGGGH